MGQAWAPLVRGMRFDHPVVKSLSEKYSKTPAQVLLRYSLQKVSLINDHKENNSSSYIKGYIPLPKSSKPERIRTNAEVFDFNICVEDMDELDGLDERMHHLISS
jgi:diketogulonate reductase-like aldo/keto reductase